METPATLAASNDRKTFTDTVHRQLDKLSVAKAMSTLGQIQEAEDFPTETPEPVAEAMGHEEKMNKAFDRNVARRKAAEAKNPNAAAKADKSDKAAADRIKKNGSTSFISTRKA